MFSSSKSSAWTLHLLQVLHKIFAQRNFAKFTGEDLALRFYRKKTPSNCFFYDEKIDCKWVKMTVCVYDRISSQQNDVLIEIVDDTANINIMVDEIA